MIATTLVGEVFHRIEEKANSYMDKTNTQETGHELIDIYDLQKGNRKICFKNFKIHHESSEFQDYITSVLKVISPISPLKWRKLVQNIYNFEKAFHKGNSIDFHNCIKKNLGTNHHTHLFYQLNKPISYKEKLINLLSKIKPLLKLLNAFRQSPASIWIKHGVLGIFRIITYYVDLVKDVLFIIVYLQYVPLSTTDLLSFNNIVFVILCTIVCLPLVANFILLAINSPLNFIRATSVRFAFAALSPLVPAISVYIGVRNDILKDLEVQQINPNKNVSSTTLSKITFYESTSRKWKKLLAKQKLNENIFENNIQVFLLLIIIFLRYTDTNTVIGLQELFASGNDVAIALSAMLSILSIIIGQLKWIEIQKDDFMPLKGKFLILMYTLISVVLRSSACIVYFAPSLGLASLLMHWKMGSLATTTTSSIYDNRGKEVFSLVYDVYPNGTRIFFTQVWQKVATYEEMTVLSLEDYVKGFIAAIFLHYLLVFVIKCYSSTNFKSFKNIGQKFHHLLNQLICPLIYKDWDDEQEDDYSSKLSDVLREMKVLLILFAIENIAMCTPLFLLAHSIIKRNQYLDEFFPQLEEEKYATHLSFALCVVCPIIYGTVPFLQYQLFLLYNTKGHPWSKLLCREEPIRQERGPVPMKKNFKSPKVDKEEKYFNDFWNLQ